MRQEKIKTAICWILVFICMGVIFWLSSRTAVESAQQSSSILQYLIEIFGDNIFTDFIVRKLAHFLEFTGLCLLMNTALFQTRKRKSFILSTALTSLYAITDEVHQLFVEGRACRISDWAIDTCGAILGTIAFAVIMLLISKVLKSKNTIDRKIN